MILVISLAVGAQTKTIGIKSLKYDPSELTIKKGMTVVWVNKDTGKTHQVYETYNNFPRSPVLWPNDEYNVTFNELGTFEFRDAAKPSKMVGNIIVVSEEDYVEEIFNQTVNETVNQTINNQTANVTNNQSGVTTNETTVNTTINTTSGTITLDEQPPETPEEENQSTATLENESENPIVLEHDEKISKVWWIVGIIVVVGVVAFFFVRQFIEIKPIEIKDEIRRKRVPEISILEKKEEPKKELRAKIINIEGNIVQIKCPKCNSVTKTIFSKPGPLDVVCGDCGARLSAFIKA